MTQKMRKAIVMIIIVILGINISHNNVYGDGRPADDGHSSQQESTTTIDSVIKGANDFLNEGKDANHDITAGGGYEVKGGQLNETKLKQTSDILYNFLLAFAMIAAVVIGMVIGIKFMVASVQEKAQIKEALVPYVAGCVIVFGAFGIWKLAITILSTW